MNRTELIHKRTLFTRECYSVWYIDICCTIYKCLSHRSYGVNMSRKYLQQLTSLPSYMNEYRYWNHSILCATPTSRYTSQPNNMLHFSTAFVVFTRENEWILKRSFDFEISIMEIYLMTWIGAQCAAYIFRSVHALIFIWKVYGIYSVLPRNEMQWSSSKDTCIYIATRVWMLIIF